MSSRSSKAIDASIIVPVRDNLALTRRCLESVRRHTGPGVEVLVVDNGSAAATRRFLDAERRAGRLRLLRSSVNLPFAAAINRGMAASRGRFLVWLNNDVVVTPGWLDRLLERLRRDPLAAAAGPCTNHADSGAGRGARHDPEPETLDAFAAAWAMKHEGQSEVVGRLSGFCLALRREARDAAGPLDERFLWGEEDEDYCFRLRLAGYRLLVARDVYVRHEGGATRNLLGARRRRALARHNRKLFEQKWVHTAADIRRQVQRWLRHGR